MSQENVEIVNRAIEAVNERDLEGYLSCCTEDMQLITPLTEMEARTRESTASGASLPTWRT